MNSKFTESLAWLSWPKRDDVPLEEGPMAAQETDTSTTRLIDSEEDRERFNNGGDGATTSRPKEPWKGEYGKSIIYAGLDAIVTSFSLISSISARVLAINPPVITHCFLSLF